MVASTSYQIEAAAGTRIKDPTASKPVYGKVTAILIGVSAPALIACCPVGAVGTVELHLGMTLDSTFVG